MMTEIEEVKEALELVASAVGDLNEQVDRQAKQIVELLNRTRKRGARRVTEEGELDV